MRRVTPAQRRANPMDARRRELLRRALDALAVTHNRVRALRENYEAGIAHEDRLLEEAIELGATIREVGAIIERSGPTALRRVQRLRRTRGAA